MRVEKNPLLCFVETINWDIIAINQIQLQNIFANNKPQNECPICPSGRRQESSGEIKDVAEAIDCPPSPNDPHQRLCWNQFTCQRGNQPNKKTIIFCKF